MNKLTAFALVLGLAFCASVPAKQKAVTTLGNVQSQLEIVQDAERRTCNQVAFDADAAKPILACEGPLSTTLGLTTAKHQEFASAMAKAYSLQKRAAIALQAWSPGQPAPAELSGLQTQAQTVLDFLKALAVTDAQKQMIASGQALLSEVQKVIAAVKG